MFLRCPSVVFGPANIYNMVVETFLYLKRKALWERINLNSYATKVFVPLRSPVLLFQISPPILALGQVFWRNRYTFFSGPSFSGLCNPLGISFFVRLTIDLNPFATYFVRIPMVGDILSLPVWVHIDKIWRTTLFYNNWGLPIIKPINYTRISLSRCAKKPVSLRSTGFLERD